MRDFGGPALHLDRSHISTDEIIPGKFLTGNARAELKAGLFTGLKLEGFDRDSRVFAEARVLVTRANFGCGSSREQAVWALQAHGITACIAESYARIFRQNMFNNGLLALTLPADIITNILSIGPRPITIDIEAGLLRVDTGTFRFELPPFEKALIDAGGWIPYAESRY